MSYLWQMNTFGQPLTTLLRFKAYLVTCLLPLSVAGLALACCPPLLGLDGIQLDLLRLLTLGLPVPGGASLPAPLGAALTVLLSLCIAAVIEAWQRWVSEWRESR
eukprot:GHVU01186508.1.p3 GENE.GHVU01186508.1~~GHVU01186508.1.p3  ORF type:complete len:105 (-),score=19.12 GHVU01186508.1:136-450(-)